MGFFKKSGGVPRGPFDLNKFLIITGVAIVLTNIIAGILGIWIPDLAEVSRQIAMGMLLFVVAAAVIIPFTLIRYGTVGVGIQTRDLVLIMLVIGLVIFLMIVIPNIFNLPKPFSVAQIGLQSMFG